MKKIILTGGGTAGHVTPNIALIPYLKEAGYDISYIGSYNGIEKTLIEGLGIPYYGISSGKLRRYLDVKNLTDPFRVVKGYSQAKKLIHEINPDIIFSKGGFVSVPVVKAADSCHIPVITHESDMTPGLANRIASRYAHKVCCNFPETVKLIPNGRGILTGTPIRDELLAGSQYNGLALCGFTTRKPVIMIIGGSLGAQRVNEAMRAILPRLLTNFNVIHICGKGKTDDSLKTKEGYIQFEYVDKELKDLFAAADVVVSRAGANAICELLAMRKPNLLIPLSAEASRGDQILNARSFEKQGYSVVYEEHELTDDILYDAIHKLYDNRSQYIKTMEASKLGNPISSIISLIEEYRRK